MNNSFLNAFGRRGRRSLLLLLLLMLIVPTISFGGVPAAKFQAHRDIFESRGTDCASRVTHQRFWFEPGIVEKRQDVFQTGPRCEVSASPVETTRVPVTSLTIPASVSGPGKWCPNLGGGFDWLHTSWTYQLSGSNTDVAWLRSSFFRLWSCTSSWWSDYSGDVYAWSGRSDGGSFGDSNTNTKPTWPFIDWPCSRQNFPCTQTLAETKADFKVQAANPLSFSPFPSKCPVSEQINVYSYSDGSWFVDFWTTGRCYYFGDPYHSSTGARVSDYESAGYGGKTDPSTKMSVAVPYVSGNV